MQNTCISKITISQKKKKNLLVQSLWNVDNVKRRTTANCERENGDSRFYHDCEDIYLDIFCKYSHLVLSGLGGEDADTMTRGS